MPDHFVVLRQEQIGALAAGASCKDRAEALVQAKEKTASDREPRYVVQVLAQVTVDPVPNVLVNLFEGELA